MVIGIPFSSWKSQSSHIVMSCARMNLLMLFVAGGLAMSWKEIRSLFYTFAVCAVASLAAASVFGKNDLEGRITMTSASGNIGNSNDLAAHLLLLMPFLVFIMMDRKRNVFFRMAMLPPIAYGVWVVLGTASRGCMLALAAMFLFSLFRATAGQRAAVLAVSLVMAVTIPFCAQQRSGALGHPI